MRKHFLLLAVGLIAATGTLFAQSADNEDEVIKIDRMNQNAYREGEILVKFKADGAVQMRAPRKAKFQTSQVNAVDALFEELGVDSVEQLMPMTGHKNVGRRVKAYNGKDVEVKDLSKLYRLTLKAEKAQTMFDAIDKLKAQEEVEFAEPNYIVYTMALPYDDSIPTADQAIYTQEPLYSQQWGIPAINLPALWDKPKRSSKRPVIAILDTGVDIEHPDLAANIWTNTAEANGIANQDDDANGFKDDIHGWSFIDNHSVTGDFNGHGTHCAGIAAAVGNNGIGITGANPDALIMPVTVMQSNGTGDVATIVKGIDYASANGADVISMSIGSYSYSIAEEQALGRAYANAVLVAAAGNDGHAMAGAHCIYDAPMFPAAFSFVLGVEASVDAIGNLASFSNYDESGPIYSSFGENMLYNYELRAPGVRILSTFPGGRYKNLNGTSMACPLVAGAVSRLIQCKETLSWELLFGDVIHTRVVGGLGNVNMTAAYNITDADRHPELSVVSCNIVDTLNGDGDGRADAGETIELFPTFKNAWGQANNIRYWVKVGYYSANEWVWDDTTLIKSLSDTVRLGKPLSSYAKAISKNPCLISIDPTCADGREINMTFFAICDNISDTLRQQVVLIVENGVEIKGLISEDLTLYPNVHYIVSDNLAVPSGVTLTIKPGTIIKMRDGYGISVSGHINAIGTPDSIIEITREEYNSGQRNEINRLYIANKDTLHYVAIKNLSSCNGTYVVEGNAVLKNCIIQNHSIANSGILGRGIRALRSCVYSCIGSTWDNQNQTILYRNCNYINNGANYTLQKSNFFTYTQFADCNVFNYDLAKYKHLSAFCIYDVPQVVRPTENNYLGTSRMDLIHERVVDINWTVMSKGFAELDLSNMYTQPVRETHGIVWKVLINGYDAQDEFEQLPPLGVGKHKCEVYFNRPMDVSVTPFVAYGVRSPYTQHTINEDGYWSADSTIYTAFFTIDAKTVSDGLNRLYIADAKDDEHFEIPYENVRFNMEIAAAGSMSTGLMAEAGLGKVTLKWETDEEDFADLLGYNIYRWTPDTIKFNQNYNYDCSCYVYDYKFDTICINTSLIDAADTAFVDYNVVPGKDYYYVIRQVTTSLNSYDLSNAVVARPLTAIKGDANGSMTVDVADVITEVNYITRQNPQPFIFEAADVNSDEQVNIIDVVATVDLILHPQAGSQAIQENTAYYYIENGILYVESDVVLGGVQCTFEAEQGHTFTALSALNEFEKVGTWQNEEQYMFMAYSMSGKTLGVGKTALLQIGDAELTDIIFSDAQGHNIATAPKISTALDGTTFVPAASKYLQEGALYIKHGKHIYNVMGTLIK